MGRTGGGLAFSPSLRYKAPVMEQPNSESASDPPGPIRLLAVSVEKKLGETLIGTLNPGNPAADTVATEEGEVFTCETCDTFPADPKEQNALLADVSVVLLHIRFLDAATLEALRDLTQVLLPKRLPTMILLVREEGEVDFKISCRECGQKLWVRDTDEGKRGRCPNCRQAFPLPSQVDHVRRELTLPDGVPITQVAQGDLPSCRDALGKVKSLLSGELVEVLSAAELEALLKKTVRVELTSPDDSSAGSA